MSGDAVPRESILKTFLGTLSQQLSEFTIEAQREVHFNLDGEPTTETELHFSVLPKQLAVAF